MPTKPKSMFKKLISITFIVMLGLVSCTDSNEQPRLNNTSSAQEESSHGFYTMFQENALPLLLPGFVQVFIVTHEILDAAIKVTTKNAAKP
jgi:hypothetical protein